MDDESLVSVIIPFFNAKRFVQEAIESVLAQTYKEWELLLVDDGSTDRGSSIALSYVEKEPTRIRYFEHEGHENRGLSASRNLGIRNAKGEYIAFLDADDVWLPRKLQEQVGILASFPEAAIVYQTGQVWYGWTGNSADIRRDYMQDLSVPVNTLVKPPRLVGLFLRSEGTVPSIASILARRRIVRHVGGFEDAFRGMYEDQVFLFKICLELPVFVASGCACRYRQHEDSMVKTALRTGQHAPARLNFLTWLSKYLKQHEVRDSDIWRVLNHQLWLWRLLSRFPVLERITEPTARLRVVLGWKAALREQLGNE